MVSFPNEFCSGSYHTILELLAPATDQLPMPEPNACYSMALAVLSSTVRWQHMTASDQLTVGSGLTAAVSSCLSTYL